MENNVPKRVPEIVFKTREKVETKEAANAASVCDDILLCWKDMPTQEVFNGKKVVVFALPGAYTPTCSAAHVPGYEDNYDEFMKLGVDEVICIAVNDTFVMTSWASELGAKKVMMLPDGNADFTRGMGMLVKKENLGFGERSWRYSMYVEDGEIKKMFIEPGKEDNAQGDPYEVSDAETMLKYLKGESE